MDNLVAIIITLVPIVIFLWIMKKLLVDWKVSELEKENSK